VAIALVQQKMQADAATTAGNITFTSTATAGNLLIVLIGLVSLETATAVTGGWTKDMGGSSSLRVHCYSKVADGSETAFAWTGSVSQGQACNMWEFSGIAGGVLDQFANGSGTTVTSMSTGTTPTTTAADEVAVAVVACGSSLSGPATWSNSFINGSVAFASSRWSYKILSATGTQESTFGVWTTARTGNSAILTYKAGAAAAASLVPPRRSMQHLLVR
jgi:hypothetical protein